MSRARLERPWSEADFFAWQSQQSERYELVNGYPIQMMSGARRAHDRIVRNIIAQLHGQLGTGKCEAFTADFAVRTATNQIRRPDAGVDCGADTDAADSELVAADPRLVVEVLSESTKRFDLFDKLSEYQQVPSLTHVVYIDPDELAVRHWERRGGEWILVVLEDAKATIFAADLDLSISLDDIYAGTSALRTSQSE